MPVPLAEAGELAAETFKSLESGMRRTEAGNDFANLFKEKYFPKLNQNRQELVTQALQMPKHLQPAPHEIESMAKNKTRMQVLGSNDYRGVGLIKAIEKQPGLNPLQIRNEQQSLADHVHMVLKDTVPNKRGPQSKFKMNVERPFTFHPVTGEKIPNVNRVPITTDARYHPAGPVERLVTKVANVTMLPAILIPHIGTMFNIATNGDLRDLTKGFVEATLHNSNLKQAIADTGIFAGTASHAYTAKYYGSRGFMSKLGGDKFGEIMYNVVHQPGFNAMRDWQLAIAGAGGKLVAERQAQALLKNGGQDKIAIYQLKKMGLTPADIIAKGGLDPDMLRRAIYNFVDRRLFLDNTMQRSFYSSANAFMRLTTMYHGYVSRQGKLMADLLWNEAVKGKSGLVGAAQALGMLGIVFPTVGAGLKTLEMYGRGQFQEADPKEDFKKLTGQEGGKEFLKEYIAGYTHMGAYGVATDYFRGMSRHMLLNSAAGPVGNEIANLAQDTLHAGLSYDPDKPNKSLIPLERDVLADTMPDNIGKILVHQLLPTKQEEKERHGSHKLTRLKSLRLKRLAKLQ
jgi:hypothetical protein